jgi:hypothetical protein
MLKDECVYFVAYLRSDNRKGKGACAFSSRLAERLERLDFSLYFDFRLGR